MKLRELADFVVRPRLLTVPGVAQVIPIGGEVRQYRVVPDPRKMATLDVGLEAIEKAVQVVRRQHRRRLRRPPRARIPDPQHRRARSRSRTCADLVVALSTRPAASVSSRWPTSSSPPAPSAATPASRQAGRGPGHPEAARRRHRHAHPRDRARAAGAAESHAEGRAGRATCSSARRLSSSARSPMSTRAAGGAGGRRHRPVPVPAQLADDLHLAHGHPDVDRRHAWSCSSCSGCRSTP